MNNEPMRILLADDDEGDRTIFLEAFSELKIKTEVSTVNDGVQLMECLSIKDNPLPDFLFLDLNMPRKNGLECLIEIRKNENTKDIFVAIYSTSNNEKDVEDTFFHGANVYITKPDSFKNLKQALEKTVMTASIYQDKNLKKENFMLRV